MSSEPPSGTPFELDVPPLAQAFREGMPAGSPPFELVGHAGHPRLAHLAFLEEGRIHIELARRYPTAGIRANMATRALAMRPLFAHVRSRAPDLVGSCPLWLGDIPETSGLAFCGNSTSHVLIPDPDFIGSGGHAAFRRQLEQDWIAWSRRSDTLYWRGSLTGNAARHPVARWQDIPRVALCLHARRSPLAASYDCALTGDHVQRRDRAALPAITQAGLFAPRVGPSASMAHRFLIDIDGNSASWAGLFTKLMMGSTVLKVESRHGFRQWYYDRLQPWVNIVPVDRDLRDLDEIVLWLRAHPETAEMIGRNALALSRTLTPAQAFEEALPRIVSLVQASPPRPEGLRWSDGNAMVDVPTGERDGT